ncbi:MAG: TolB protein [Arcobacteraceae bacterium]|jgi:TolB protein
MLKLVLLFFLFEFAFSLDATMEIVKNKSSLPTINVAVSTDSLNENEISSKLLKLIKKDLQVSCHFNDSEISLESEFSEMTKYKILATNKIDLYLLFQVSLDDENRYVINTKLYDVNLNSLVQSKSYVTSSFDRYPFLAHKIAIDINKYLKAPSIEWMDKFVIFSRYLDSKTSEIVISDYTLTYQKVVVKGGLSIFPKWASSEQSAFYYTSYKGLVPALMKQDLYTNKLEQLLTSDGMIVCSDVSADGTKLVLTMAPNSQPDIYVYDTETRIKTRITKYVGIDVGGSFVENDTKIVFVSDRLKYPNIFAKKIGQNGVERMIYHGKNNSQSTTSDDYIVYSSRETDNEFGSNVFNLYLISTKSDYVRRLTTNGRNQFPKFSSDGESLLFIKSTNKSSLGIIRINYNKSFLFPLKSGKLQSIDW